jgi:hypothetical protein
MTITQDCVKLEEKIKISRTSAYAEGNFNIKRSVNKDNKILISELLLQ